MKRFFVVLISIVTITCGSDKPLKERDIGHSKNSDYSKHVELKEISETEVLDKVKNAEKNSLLLVVKNYLMQMQDDMNLQLHRHKDSINPSFVLNKDISFSKAKSYYLDAEKRRSIGNYIFPRVLSTSSSSAMFWRCSFEGQEPTDIINTRGKNILILEVTQSNSASYSCRVQLKKWNEFEAKDLKSIIKK